MKSSRKENQGDVNGKSKAKEKRILRNAAEKGKPVGKATQQKLDFTKASGGNSQPLGENTEKDEYGDDVEEELETGEITTNTPNKLSTQTPASPPTPQTDEDNEKEEPHESQPGTSTVPQHQNLQPVTIQVRNNLPPNSKAQSRNQKRNLRMRALSRKKKVDGKGTVGQAVGHIGDEMGKMQFNFVQNVRSQDWIAQQNNQTKAIIRGVYLGPDEGPEALKEQVVTFHNKVFGKLGSKLRQEAPRLSLIGERRFPDPKGKSERERNPVCNIGVEFPLKEIARIWHMKGMENVRALTHDEHGQRKVHFSEKVTIDKVQTNHQMNQFNFARKFRDLIRLAMNQDWKNLHPELTPYHAIRESGYLSQGMQLGIIPDVRDMDKTGKRPKVTMKLIIPYANINRDPRIRMYRPLDAQNRKLSIPIDVTKKAENLEEMEVKMDHFALGEAQYEFDEDEEELDGDEAFKTT